MPSVNGQERAYEQTLLRLGNGNALAVRLGMPCSSGVVSHCPTPCDVALSKLGVWIDAPRRGGSQSERLRTDRRRGRMGCEGAAARHVACDCRPGLVWRDGRATIQPRSHHPRGSPVARHVAFATRLLMMVWRRLGPAAAAPPACLPSLRARGLWRPGLRLRICGGSMAADAGRYCGATSVTGRGRLTGRLSGHFECTPLHRESMRCGRSDSHPGWGREGAAGSSRVLGGLGCPTALRAGTGNVLAEASGGRLPLSVSDDLGCREDDGCREHQAAECQYEEHHGTTSGGGGAIGEARSLTDRWLARLRVRVTRLLADPPRPIMA